ncbi:MAG: lipase [Alphaproteobacteria bacterium]|jgi:hypothetical protein|nr:lipase [Alphaproteobacteria bacterium]
MNKIVLLTSISAVALSVAAHARVDISVMEKSETLPHTRRLTENEASPSLSKLLELPITDEAPNLSLGGKPRINMSEIISSPPLAGFTIDDTLKYAQFSSMAYVDVTNPELDKTTFSEIEKLKSEGNRVQFFGTEVENSGLIITDKDGHVSVVYKGSSSVHNFATDAWANFAIDDITGLRCHNGIMKGFYRTQDQVFAILEQIAQTRGISVKHLLENDVTVTGHSLGGGLSEMFMGYAHEIYDARVKAVTFAAPRIFDVATAKKLDGLFHDRYLNVMQVTDPVPAIAVGLLGYRHFGTKLHIPYATADWQHLMAGYTKALGALRQAGEIKVGSTAFKYEESQRTGLGNAKWIGTTSIPNPLYPLYKAREVMAEHVDPVVHKGLKVVKDGAIAAANTMTSAAKKAWGYFWK